jgi:hypothetical protein
MVKSLTFSSVDFVSKQIPNYIAFPFPVVLLFAPFCVYHHHFFSLNNKKKKRAGNLEVKDPGNLLSCGVRGD